MTHSNQQRDPETEITIVGDPPDLHDHGESVFVRARRSLRNLVRVLGVLAVLWVAGTFASYGMGMAMYNAKDNPRTYEVVLRQREMRTFMARANALTRNGFVAGLSFDNQSLRGQRINFGDDPMSGRSPSMWKRERPALLVSEEGGVHVIYEPIPGGRVARYHLKAEYIPESELTRFARQIDSSVGRVKAVAGSTDNRQRRGTAVWRDEKLGHLYLAEYEHIDGEYWSLTLQGISQLSPRYQARFNTGGLPPWHPHAREIAEQLAGETQPDRELLRTFVPKE